MKIGIITYWWSQDNYGQILQCYALQTFLRNMGHDAFLIRNKENVKNKRDIKWFCSLPLKIIRIILNPNAFLLGRKFGKLETACVEVNKKHSRDFDVFKEKYIKSTSIYTQEELFSNPPDADVYMCGSDQIWSGVNPVYFLNFKLPRTVKRISYAASFGKTKLSKKNIKKIAPWLKQFDVVTVRESSGIDICKEADRDDAICVPDPTLLLSSEAYMQLIENIPQNKEKYILLYLLGNEVDFDISEFYKYASSKGLKVKYVASQGRIDQYGKIYPTISEWLHLIKDAEYVVTNSFHGSVFAITFNKKFLVIPLCGLFSKMNSRIDELLQMFNLGDRLYSDSISAVEKEIDYNVINEKLFHKRDEVEILVNKWFNT